jgi:hypothetical protein
MVGPAYNASYVLAKTHDITVSPEADEDHWLAAAEWSDSIGVDIVSSSMVIYYSYESHDGETTPVALATRTMASHGILFVCAMGNNGPSLGTLWSPADCESILAVGSVDNNNLISSFSSRGPSFDGRGKPDLVAQGANTVWADAGSSTGLSGYDGTSLATPLVSGVAALVQEAHPEWTAQEVRYAMKSTADKASAPDSTAYGWGRPDAVKAIYQSALGGPIFPRPFALISPAGAVSPIVSTTFQWRRTVDPNPGDAISYTIEVRLAGTSTVLFTTSTPDTFVQCVCPFTPGATYEWEVFAKDPANHSRPSQESLQFTVSGDITAVETPDESTGPPRILQMSSRPNPFETTTQIEFHLQGGSDAPISLRIYDSRGRLVRTLLQNSTRAAASVPWDGRTDAGVRAASGVYYYRLEMGSARFIRRLILLK